MRWALPLDPSVRCIHMGDITELGNIVAGAFAHPDQAGKGEYLPLVGDFMSFNEIVDTLNQQGHDFSFVQVPADVFATFFPGAAEIGAMFQGKFRSAYLLWVLESRDRIALANKNSRPATNQIFNVGSTECPGPEPLNAAIHSMRIEIMETLLDHVIRHLQFRVARFRQQVLGFPRRNFCRKSF